MCYSQGNTSTLNLASARKSSSISDTYVTGRFDKVAESHHQGHRLSSYASTSSQKQSPKTPKKCSSPAISVGSECNKHTITHCSNGNQNSNIHNQHIHNHNYISSGHSYSNINNIQPLKESTIGGGLSGSQTDCVLKCTCPNNTSYNSMKLAKTTVHNVQLNAESKNIPKHISDAATSPGRLSNCQRSPKLTQQSYNSHDNESCFYFESKIDGNNLPTFYANKIQTTKPTASPRRLVTTRNAATSPHLDLRKLSRNNDLKTPELSNRIILEKSNSLGDSKPLRQLRTTRSLSPRPPVRHQHAITVSDENDIVSIKVSPNEDYDLNNVIIISNKTGTKKKHKAKSEHNSPNLSADIDTVFIYDKSGMNNKSTGCLVYVPSDPWLKMSDIGGTGDGSLSLRKRTSNSKISKETRSLSRNDLEPVDTDPWIWRKHPEIFKIQPTNRIPRSPKRDNFRQTKSFSTTKFEITNSPRPKLQRSKSPLKIEDDISMLPQPPAPPQSPSSPFLIAPDPQYTAYIYPTTSKICDKNAASSYNDRKSPRKIIKEKPPAQLNKSLLNVVNPNVIQARHSFSSVSEKDDELQLNIRRLSEQIKHNQTSSGADFSDYLKQFRNSEAKKAAEAIAAANLEVITKSPRTTANKNTDSVLETTC